MVTRHIHIYKSFSMNLADFNNDLYRLFADTVGVHQLMVQIVHIFLRQLIWCGELRSTFKSHLLLYM